jgi:hypothetical protein
MGNPWSLCLWVVLLGVSGCGSERLTAVDGSGDVALDVAADSSGSAAEADADAPDTEPADSGLADSAPADTSDVEDEGSADTGAADTAADVPRDTAADTAFDGDTAAADGSGDTTDPREGCPELRAPGIEYVSFNAFSCERWNGNCDAGYLPFENRCGCGCSLSSGSCPAEGEPGVTWVSTDPAACAFEVPSCGEGLAWFYASCGCGCAPVPPPPCAPETFLPAGLVVEGATCGEALFCGRTGAVTAGIGAVTTAYADAACSVDVDPLCPASAAFSCRALVDSIDGSDYEAFCALSVTGSLSQIRCSAP